MAIQRDCNYRQRLGGQAEIRYLRSFDVTDPAFFRALSALLTDCSPALSPLRPIFSRISPRPSPSPASFNTLRMLARFDERRPRRPGAPRLVLPFCPVLVST